MIMSVVIPTYNGAEFIAEALESVLSQSRRPDEILVIDDGSTDNTAQIAEGFGEVILRANAKQSSNRNFGVQEARGQWIAFIDQDDLWKPNKLARQVEELQRSPGADLCYTARQEFTVKDGSKKWDTLHRSRLLSISVKHCSETRLSCRVLSLSVVHVLGVWRLRPTL